MFVFRNGSILVDYWITLDRKLSSAHFSSNDPAKIAMNISTTNSKTFTENCFSPIYILNQIVKCADVKLRPILGLWHAMLTFLSRYELHGTLQDFWLGLWANYVKENWTVVVIPLFSFWRGLRKKFEGIFSEKT